MNTHRPLAADTIPGVGTPIQVTTTTHRVYRGRIRHISRDTHGGTIIGIQDGAGWWSVALVDIANLRVTGQPRPFRLHRGSGIDWDN